MSKTLRYTISLGGSKAGLTLQGQLYTYACVPVGSRITTGFGTAGGGCYVLQTTTDDDSFDGFLAVYNGASTIPLGVGVEDSPTFAKTGTAISLGPTACRSSAPIHYTCHARGTLGLYARVIGWDGVDLTPSAVQSIRYTCYTEAGEEVAGHVDAPLVAADVVMPAVQSDAWASDYNLRIIPDVSTHDAFPTEGNYTVEVEIMPKSGQKIIVEFRVRAT